MRVAALYRLYLRLQREMEDHSSNSRLVLVADTGHCIMCDQPKVVIDAVRDVVQATGVGSR